MPPWLLALIGTTVITTLVGMVVKLWGEAISKWFAALLMSLVMSTTVTRNRLADEDYQRTITATVEALKERISLLEKWRQEAQELSDHIDELENQIRQLRLDGLDKDDKLYKLTEELKLAQRELDVKAGMLKHLQADLLSERSLVAGLQTKLNEAIAVQSDTQLKIGAILHHVTGGANET